MLESQREILKLAVVNRAPAVLSLPKRDGWSHHKSRLVGLCEEGIWLALQSDNAEQISNLIHNCQRVGVAFKTATSKVMFSAIPLRRDDTKGAALLQFPQDLNVGEKRDSFRVCIPKFENVPTRVWQIPEFAVLRDKPLASQEARGQLVDVSANGMGFVCSKEMEAGQRLRVVIEYEDVEVLAEGRVKHARQIGNLFRIGVRFEKLDGDLEAKQMGSRLAKIVGQLRRRALKTAKS